MKCRYVTIYRADTHRVEIHNLAKLRTAWQAHRRSCGLIISQTDYLAALVRRVESEGFQANDPEVTGVVIRPERSLDQVVVK